MSTSLARKTKGAEATNKIDDNFPFKTMTFEEHARRRLLGSTPEGGSSEAPPKVARTKVGGNRIIRNNQACKRET